jgi:hypothetical protein
MIAPFGIEFFSPLESLEVTGDLGQNKYQVQPPSPHPLFQTYIVQATPSLGVVWIKGVSEPKAVDIFGNSLRADVDRVAQQLAGKYGAGRKNDMLLHGSFWEGAQYWMNALADHQRVYFYLWEAKERSALPDGLATIFAGATGYNSAEGAVTLEYASDRIEEAEQETEAGMSDLL